jgi:hypothetical protein
MCKPYLCVLGHGALESLNKQNNNSSDAIEQSEFSFVRNVEKEITRISCSTKYISYFIC